MSIANWHILWYPVRMARILEAIIDAIEASDESRHAIAQRAGVNPSQLARLVSGERGLSIETAERVAETLGLEIIIRPKRRNRKAGK